MKLVSWLLPQYTVASPSPNTTSFGTETVFLSNGDTYWSTPRLPCQKSCSGDARSSGGCTFGTGIGCTAAARDGWSRNWPSSDPDQDRADKDSPAEAETERGGGCGCTFCWCALGTAEKTIWPGIVLVPSGADDASYWHRSTRLDLTQARHGFDRSQPIFRLRHSEQDRSSLC
jgi:hypothetical protein